MVARVALGELLTNQWGLRASKPGVDVFSGSPDEFLFDSLNPNMRVIQTGSCATTYDSGNNRTFVTSAQVQLPPVDYEPIVFMCFIGIISDVMALDTMKGQRYTTLWLSGQQLANPKDYAEYTWDAANNRLTFNARCLRMTTPWTSNSQWEFRYIVFSNRGN